MTMPTPQQMLKLNSYRCIAEIEDDGLDEGRFLIHLVSGYDWAADPHNVTRSKSFASYADARYWLDKRVKPTGA